MSKKNKKTATLVSTDPNGQGRPRLLDKLIENTVAQVATFFFSTCLVTASTYLLFQTNKEKLSIARERIQFNKPILTDDKPFADMLNSWDSANTYSTGRVNKIQSTVKHLSKNIEVKKLDDQFIHESIGWLNESGTYFATELGKIKGFTFSEQVYKDMQEDFVRHYESEKDFFDGVRELITEWDTMTSDKRRKRFVDVIKGKGEKVLTPNRQIYQRAEQLKDKVKLREEERKQQLDEIDDLSKTMSRKRYLAFIGIVIGVLFFLGLLFIYFRKLITRVKQDS